MKLNLGAGYERLGADWVKVDLDPNTHPDYVMDVRTLPKEFDGQVDEIRAVDILEHLSYRDTVPTLQCWARALRSGGRMYLQVPAADRMMAAFVEWDHAEPGLLQKAKDVNLDRNLPDDLCSQPLPMIVRLAWRLLGGHYDQQYTRSSSQWYLNAHHALFDEETIRWAAEQAGLQIESLEVNPHPNYCVWLVKP